MAFSTAFFSKAQHSRDQFSTLRLACVRKAKQCMYHPYVWVEGNLPTTKQHPRTTHWKPALSLVRSLATPSPNEPARTQYEPDVWLSAVPLVRLWLTYVRMATVV